MSSTAFTITAGISAPLTDLAFLKPAVLYADRTEVCIATKHTEDPISAVLYEDLLVANQHNAIDLNTFHFPPVDAHVGSPTPTVHTHKQIFGELDVTVTHYLDEQGGIVDVSRCATDLFNHLVKAISNASAYPLLDLNTAELVKSTFSRIQISQAHQVHLATDLLRYFDGIEAAPMDELISIRQELQAPLTAFRSAVMKLSAQVRTEPWSEDFSREVQSAYDAEIRPALVQIEEAIHADSALRTLIPGLRRFVDGKVVSGSVIGFGVSQIFSSLELLIPALALGLGTKAVTAFYDTFLDWKAKQNKIAENKFYFCHQVQGRLSK